jgi:hypothetical protein
VEEGAASHADTDTERAAVARTANREPRTAPVRSPSTPASALLAPRPPARCFCFYTAGARR